jgi:DNA-binding GntR family transcriptional regulator
MSDPIRTVAVQVADGLRTEILSGRILPGTRLLQDEEAERLGVSRTPVRDAFRQLEKEMLVEIVPNRGAIVTRLSLDDIREIYLIRQQLEPLAAMSAAHAATDEDVDAIEDVLSELSSAPDDEDPSRLLDLNKRFHFRVYEASHLPQLVKLIGSLWGPIEAVRASYVAAPLTAKHAAVEHRQLFLAIKQRDGNAAAEITRNHLAATESGLVERLRRLGHARGTATRRQSTRASQSNVS